MNLSEATFGDWRQHHNLPGLRIGAWLVVLLLPSTWFFDLMVLPEDAAMTGTVRFLVAVFAGVILLTMRGVPRVAERNADNLSSILTVLVAACAATVTFVHGGYASPLFVVFLLVFLGASQLFTWTLGRAILLYTAVAAIFVAPWALNWLPPPTQRQPSSRWC